MCNACSPPPLSSPVLGGPTEGVVWHALGSSGQLHRSPLELHPGWMVTPREGNSSEQRVGKLVSNGQLVLHVCVCVCTRVSAHCMCLHMHVLLHIPSAYPPLDKFLKVVSTSPLSCTAATFSSLLELVVTKEKTDPCKKGRGHSLYKPQRWSHQGRLLIDKVMHNVYKEGNKTREQEL